MPLRLTVSPPGRGRVWRRPLPWWVPAGVYVGALDLLLFLGAWWLAGTVERWTVPLLLGTVGLLANLRPYRWYWRYQISLL